MIITPSLSVGIIGGRGRTGRQFARLFRSAGFRVRCVGSRDHVAREVLVREADLLIFSVPLSHAADIMRRTLRAARRVDQLILDVSSLKVRECRAMTVAKGEVIGMHPLFGPTTDPRGEMVILCPVRASTQTVRSLRALLHTCELRTKILTPLEHDRLMTTVQVIPHLKSLLMADLLRRCNADLAAMLGHCTPTYRMEFNVIGRFLDDHPDLYMPIIFRNPQTPRLLRLLRRILDEYISIADTQSLMRAEKRYHACRRHFASYLASARAQSEACIRTLLSLRK